MMLLTPSIKTYAWGRIGTKSLVAQLAAVFKPISGDTPYAELWMGSHPSGSCTLENGQTLTEYINENPDVLGKDVYSKFGPTLPFLFKVLSVETALSIQAHPDKNLASILHRRDPTNYADDNHKPEMAIAVTPFEVLCGFRSLTEIQNLIHGNSTQLCLLCSEATQNQRNNIWILCFWLQSFQNSVRLLAMLN